MCANPTKNTGKEPINSKRTAVLRGPQVSHSLPMINRAIMVAVTEAIMILPTCPLLKCNSPLMVGIKGARPNHPKKHTKNMSQVMWKVRICTPFKLKIFSFSNCFVFVFTLSVLIFIRINARRQLKTYLSINSIAGHGFPYT